MPSFLEDIEEFMKLPYQEVIKPAKFSGYLINIMFPFGINTDSLINYYKSDFYSSTLFLRAAQSQNENEPSMTQTIADIVDSYYTQPRILCYRCGTSMIALGLKAMNCNNITIADTPNKYFNFLKFISSKYGLEFKFINLDSPEEDQIKRKYDVIIYAYPPTNWYIHPVFDKEITLIDHLENRGYLYIHNQYHNLEVDYIKKISEDETGGIILQKIFEPAVKIPEKPKQTHKFPNSIALLSTLPKEACGIATYTKWLETSLSNHYHTGIFRDINSGVPEDALILASIEFGIFPETQMLINDKYLDNWKFAIWHTVLREPDEKTLQYVNDIDEAYDGHIVHTVLQKTWLSIYVSKPVYLIPHGTLIWNPIPIDEARQKLGLPNDDIITFSFGFASQSKGLEELIEASTKVDIPNFKMIISASIHGNAIEYTEKIKDYLNEKSEGTKTIILGKFLSEEEVNLYSSAANILIFNYKTPHNVASPSGALHRVLAAGKPIICVDDNRLESVVEGQHCLKFKYGDVDGIVNCIKILANNPDISEKIGNNCRILSEQTSWDNVAINLLKIFGEKIKFGQDYYDEEYFVGSGGGKKYITPTGELKEWSYYNPDGEWLGAKPIMDAIKTIINPENMLSVGEGRGTFCSYAKEAGIDSHGIDFSKWAIEHPYPKSSGLIELGDIRDLKFQDNSYDLVFASDILEHVYLEDLPKAISEIQRVSKRWIFCNIGASMMDDDKGDLVVSNDGLPPKDRLVTTVAGHVTVKSENWWREKLSNDKWKLRDDLVADFRRLVPEGALTNWKCIIILERID